jgi:hypothetical protein
MVRAPGTTVSFPEMLPLDLAPLGFDPLPQPLVDRVPLLEQLAGGAASW